VQASVNKRAAEREVATRPDVATPKGRCDGAVMKKKSWKRESERSQLQEEVRGVTKEAANLGVAASLQRRWW
jgi:hypothetical protein